VYPLTHQLGDVQVQFVEPENKSHVLSKTLSTSYLKKKSAFCRRAISDFEKSCFFN